MDLSDSSVNGRGENSLQALPIPRRSCHLTALSVCTLNQTEQKGALERTIGTLKVYVCCASEMRMQDPSSVVALFGPHKT